MLNNLPQVTKNLLILNIIFFVAKLFLASQGIDLAAKLGAHYVNSPFFEPFQVVTHFFMHANFIHIFFNMWIFIMLGGYLERVWGPKRFFIFYIISAFGAFALFNVLWRPLQFYFQTQNFGFILPFPSKPNGLLALIFFLKYTCLISMILVTQLHILPM